MNQTSNPNIPNNKAMEQTDLRTHRTKGHLDRYGRHKKYLRAAADRATHERRSVLQYQSQILQFGRSEGLLSRIFRESIDIRPKWVPNGHSRVGRRLLRARLKRCARALFPVTLSGWNAADRTTVISPMPNGAAWSRWFPPPNMAGVPPNTLGVRS